MFIWKGHGRQAGKHVRHTDMVALHFHESYYISCLLKYHSMFKKTFNSCMQQPIFNFDICEVTKKSSLQPQAVNGQNLKITAANDIHTKPRWNPIESKLEKSQNTITLRTKISHCIRVIIWKPKTHMNAIWQTSIWQVRVKKSTIAFCQRSTRKTIWTLHHNWFMRYSNSGNGY